LIIVKAKVKKVRIDLRRIKVFITRARMCLFYLGVSFRNPAADNRFDLGFSFGYGLSLGS
jgi:hypothetical protein